MLFMSPYESVYRVNEFNFINKLVYCTIHFYDYLCIDWLKSLFHYDLVSTTMSSALTFWFIYIFLTIKNKTNSRTPFLLLSIVDQY